MYQLSHPGSIDHQFVGIDLVPAATAVLDRSGVIHQVNSAWTEFAEANGYRGGDFIGTNYLHVCDGACGAERGDALAFGDGLRQVLDGRAEQFSLTYPCHAPDRERWFKALAKRHGEIAVVSHVDITPEYQSAARMTDPVWNRAALHEIKTPLNSVRGYADLALTELERGGGTVSVGDCLQAIRASSDDMLRVINDVLRNAQSATLSEEDVPVAMILTEIRGRHEGAAVRDGVDLDSDAPPDLHLLADPDRLTKVLDNLISNAVKYSREGSAVMVSAGLNPAGGVEIAVTDRGVGIPPDKLSAIFNPYVRLAEQQGMAEREGSGLGLAVARKLMFLHGGDIRVDSTPGAGSRFTVVFPSWRTLPAGDEARANSA